MDIIKIIGVLCACLGTLIAAYKFFWKAPSEKETSQAENKPETIATRLVALFESHGVHRNQIPEFFGHGLDIPSCTGDDKLLEKITPEIISQAAALFGVNKDWLEGSSNEIYNIPDFYKHPERFDSYIADLVEKIDADKLSAYALIADKKIMNIYNDSLFVLAEPIGEINQREIYRYHLLGSWGIHYWKSRAYFTACCALLYKHGLLVIGQIVKRNWVSEIYEGQTLLEYDYTERYGGVNFPTVGSFIVSDFVEMPDNYLKGMDTEQGRAIPLALSKWLSLSENGYMRCFPKDEAFHAGVEKTLRKNWKKKHKGIYILEGALILINYATIKFWFTRLRPAIDITCNPEGKVIIGDTKWKLINENKPGEKYNVSESDIYQMLAYNRTYQKSEGEGAEIWLIYPMSENFTQIIPDFKLDNGAVIKVRPFDINRSLLI